MAGATRTPTMQNDTSPSGQQVAGQITPELVQKVTDKVIEKLLLDLKYEYERFRRYPGKRARG
jgi:hypothetical protein